MEGNEKEQANLNLVTISKSSCAKKNIDKKEK